MQSDNQHHEHLPYDPGEYVEDRGAFLQVLRRTIEPMPKRDCHRIRGNAWTYDEVNRKSNQIARYLLNRGFEREDRIGICMDRSALAIISMIGIMKAGCAFVPLDPEFPKDRLSYIVDDAGIKTVFCVTQTTVISSGMIVCLPSFLIPMAKTFGVIRRQPIGLYPA